MGNSVTLEIHASGELTVNGDHFQGRPWIETLRWIFSKRIGRTLQIWADSNVRLGRVLTVLDQVQERPFIDHLILLTPEQINDIENDFCIINEWCE